MLTRQERLFPQKTDLGKKIAKRSCFGGLPKKHSGTTRDSLNPHCLGKGASCIYDILRYIYI